MVQDATQRWVPSQSPLASSSPSRSATGKPASGFATSRFHQTPYRASASAYQTSTPSSPHVKSSLYSHRKETKSTRLLRFLANFASWARVQLLPFATRTARLFVGSLRWNLAAERLFSLPNLLAALWILVLIFGESWIFFYKVQNCAWERWEDWPDGAQPHRLILIADPQLTDAHSYPHNPDLLNTLVATISDNYMIRSYGELQTQLRPDSIFFLGDLFDGGREWHMRDGKPPLDASKKIEEDMPWWRPPPDGSVEKTAPWMHNHGDDYWRQEFARFSDIFLSPYDPSHVTIPYSQPSLGSSSRSDGTNDGVNEQPMRRIVASLPGNHDLGYADLIQLPVRKRFAAYFGEPNRVDVIGNHSIVSIDAVSLSARSAASSRDHNLEPIHGPVEAFLRESSQIKQAALQRELDLLYGNSAENITESPSSRPITADLPTILLTHVPLYREPGTPCGPLRERYPPSISSVDHLSPSDPQRQPGVPSEELPRDGPNSLPVATGYQYSTVLEPRDSEFVMQSISNVQMVFSGDDHDYCDIIHRPELQNAREITVKSISMTMGVKIPAFQMVSLYNPIDEEGKSLATDAAHKEEHKDKRALTPTIQTHMCRLPNQLQTFANYAWFALVSVILLAVRATLVPLSRVIPLFDHYSRSRGDRGSYLNMSSDSSGWSFGRRQSLLMSSSSSSSSFYKEKQDDDLESGVSSPPSYHNNSSSFGHEKLNSSTFSKAPHLQRQSSSSTSSAKATRWRLASDYDDNNGTQYQNAHRHYTPRISLQPDTLLQPPPSRWRALTHQPRTVLRVVLCEFGYTAGRVVLVGAICWGYLNGIL